MIRNINRNPIRSSLVVALLTCVPALANPRVLPFTYPYESLAQGGLEIEQFVDLTPVLTISE